jgi:nucleoside-diphosphate-sugar epimerase
MTNNGDNAQAAEVFVVGCGDVGLRVAALEQAAGRQVSALARSEASALQLAGQGIQSVPGDLDRPDCMLDLSVSAELVYYFAPPPPVGEDDPRIAALLSALVQLAWSGRLVYISTSGVYGDCGGAWVDEDWPINPCSERARRRAAAEARLYAWAGDRVILRVPGIYGPGRLPVERLQRGVPVVREDESPWSNRIHADDLAKACFNAARLGQSGRVYNISDGNPSTMTDYFFHVADTLALPRPPEISLEEARRSLGPGILSFLAESKRLDNRRMREELGVEPRYPDLASGLAACLAAK